MGINFSKLARNEGILVPLINRYQDRGVFPEYWNIEIRNSKGSDKNFHPSGDCYESIENLYAKLMGEEKENKIGYSLRRVFDVGHMMHGYYQNILVDMGVAKQEDIEKGLVFHHPDGWIGKGTLDMIVEIPRKGLFIVDGKTVNDKEFDEGIKPETLKKWTAQVNCYMDWTGIHDAFVLAIRKGGTKAPGSGTMHDLKEIAIPYDPKLIQHIYKRWSLVYACAQTKTPPTAEQIAEVSFENL
jgi:hypothetical protein